MVAPAPPQPRRVITAYEAQKILEGVIPQRVIPHQELIQVERHAGVLTANPSQLPQFREDLTRFAPVQEAALQQAERGDPNAPNQLNEADALMRTLTQARLDGIPPEETLIPVRLGTEEGHAVSSVRSPSTHALKTTVMDVDITEFRVLAELLSNTTNPREKAQVVRELRERMTTRGVSAQQLRVGGVDIQQTELGGEIVSVPEYQATGGGKSENEKTTPGLPEGEKTGVSGAASLVRRSGAIVGQLTNRMRAGYDGLESTFEAESTRLVEEQEQFERLKRDLEDRLRRIQATIDLNSLQRNQQVQEDLRGIANATNMEFTEENASKALKTATLIANLEEEQKGQEVKVQGESGGLNPLVKKDTETVLGVANSLDNEFRDSGVRVDYLDVLAAAQQMTPKGGTLTETLGKDKELVDRVRAEKEKEMRRHDLKQVLSTPDGKRKDVWAGTEERLGGMDTEITLTE